MEVPFVKAVKKSNIIIYALLALFSACCDGCYKNNAFFEMSFSGGLLFLFKVLFYFAFFLVLHSILAYLKSHPILALNKYDFSIKKLALFLFFSWLPYAVIFYPGTSSYDTANMIIDFFNGTESMPFGFVEGQETINVFLNDGNPIFATFIFASFHLLGRLIHNYNLAMFVYVILQMLLTAFSLSYMVGSMKKWGVRDDILKLSVFFLAFMPFIPLHAISMLRDSLHSAIYVLYFTIYLDFILEQKSEDNSRTRRIIGFVILSVLIVLTKKTGIYFIIISNLALLFYTRKQKLWKSLVWSLIIPAILIFLIYPKIVYPCLNIFPGGKHELFGTCFQQTAQNVIDHPEAYSEEDIAAIDKLIPFDPLVSEFNSLTSDPVKATYRLHASNDEIMDYLKVWIQHGIKYPLDYVKATLSICGGFFSPNKDIDMFDGVPTATVGAYSVYSNPAALASLRAAAYNIYYWLSSVPGIDLLFKISTYIWFLPMAAIIALYDKRRRKTLVPTIVNLLVLIVSPICYARYGIHMLYTFPIVIGLGYSDLD